MRDLYNLFEKPKDPLAFNALRISLASPEKIREFQKETSSAVIKMVSAMILGETVPEFVDVEKWLVKVEQQKGSPFVLAATK